MLDRNQEDTINRCKKVIEQLTHDFPDAKCSLNFSNPLELLIATILSAQCTDARVNKVTPALFKKYRTPQDFVAVAQEELGEDIRSTGFFNNKAKNIQRCCAALIERHKEAVPKTMEELVKLPGIGRKTANVLLGNAFGIPGITVDTHVKRLSSRLGFSDKSNPDKIELDLNEIVPQSEWTHFSHLLIDHGRKTCQAKKPLCAQCTIKELCPSRENTND